MTERTADGFGGRLREARERRGITLRQIANKTKISIASLEALERNDISRLPGGLFSRAFVRSYAVEVGLDPEATIQEFIAQFPHDLVMAGHPASGPLEDNDALESQRRVASTIVRLAAISLPIVGVVLYYGAAGIRGTPPREPPPLAPAAEATAGSSGSAVAAVPVKPDAPLPAAGASPAAPASVPPTVEAPPAVTAGRLAIGLAATAPCWVSAFVDGRQVLRRDLKSGERHMFVAQRDFVISLGDAGALTLTLNGAPARPLGRPGQVLESLRINPTNFTDFLAAP
jgi:cytoskeletal protein RodZ